MTQIRSGMRVRVPAHDCGGMVVTWRGIGAGMVLNISTDTGERLDGVRAADVLIEGTGEPLVPVAPMPAEVSDHARDLGRMLIIAAAIRDGRSLPSGVQVQLLALASLALNLGDLLGGCLAGDGTALRLGEAVLAAASPGLRRGA